MNSGIDYGIRSEIGSKLYQEIKYCTFCEKTASNFTISTNAQIRAKMINNVLEFLMY